MNRKSNLLEPVRSVKRASVWLILIGPKPEFPGCFFAFGFGGNGIAFTANAAKILADLLTGQQDADAELFRFGR